MLGEFVLRERLDAGGYGAIYRAVQPVLERDAVVKVLHQRLRRRDAAVTRFLREAQIASRLEHQYAAHIYALGIEDDGTLWIAMELVRGTTLDRWLADHGPMPLDQLVPFLERVAQVVHAAHKRGIVHRDLKPSNIMVVESADELLPKLLDFGVARLLDEIAPAAPLADTVPIRSPRIAASTNESTPRRLTRGSQAIGSPPYMAPEQWVTPLAVGSAADIYALGVLAYEALTGNQPFVPEAGTAAEYATLHCHGAIPLVGAGLPVELDEILQRALAKRPEDRYASALELAAALRGVLATQPSEILRATASQWDASGRQPGRLLSGRELARVDRSPQLPMAALVGEPVAPYLAASRRALRRKHRLLTVLGVAGALGGYAYRQATRAEMTERLLVESEVERGRSGLLHGELASARQHLLEAHRRGDQTEATNFMLARAMQPRLAEQAVLHATSGRMWATAWSPSGRRFVTTDDKAAQVWDAATHRRLLLLPHRDTVYWVGYSDNGSQILTASGDGSIRAWNADTGSLDRELRTGGQWRYTTAARYGDTIAAMDRTGTAVHVWSLSTGALVADLRGDGTELASLAWSRGGNWLAISGGDDVRVFDVRTWKEALRIAGPRVQCLDFGPADQLVVGTEGGDVSIWDIPSGARAHHLREVGEPVDRVAWSQGGGLVAAASRDGTLQAWRDGKLQSSIGTRGGKVYALEFDSMESSLLAASGDGTVEVADPWSGLITAVLDGPSSLIRGAHFDPSSSRILGASFDGSARVWSSAPTYRRRCLPNEEPAAVSSDDQQVVRRSPSGRVSVVIPAGDGAPELWSEQPSRRLIAQLVGHGGRVWSVRVEDDTTAITTGADGTVRIWDAQTGALVQTLRSEGVNASRYLADAAVLGSLVVAGGGDGVLRFWDRSSGEQIWTLQASRFAITGVDFVLGGVVSRDAHGSVARWSLTPPESVIQGTVAP